MLSHGYQELNAIKCPWPVLDVVLESSSVGVSTLFFPSNFPRSIQQLPHPASCDYPPHGSF